MTVATLELVAANSDHVYDQTLPTLFRIIIKQPKHSTSYLSYLLTVKLTKTEKLIELKEREDRVGGDRAEEKILYGE